MFRGALKTELKLMPLQEGAHQAPCEEFILDKDQILIGRAPHCDISLDDKSISFYHALIRFDLETKITTIIDLGSVNGLFVNSHKVSALHPQLLHAGDLVEIGTIKLQVQEVFDKIPLVNLDEKVSRRKIDECTHHLHEPIVISDQFTLIDNEYCDIVFNQIEEIIEKNPLEENGGEYRDYIDPHEHNTDLFIDLPELDQESLDKELEGQKSRSNTPLCLNFSIFVNDALIDIVDKEASPGTYSLSSQKNGKRVLFTDLIPLVSDLNLFSLDTDKGLVASPPANDHFQIKMHSKYEIEFVTSNGVRLHVKLGHQLKRIDFHPLIGFDQKTKKEAYKVFTGFFVFFLIMLLIPTHEVIFKEQEEISIVYRPTPQESPQESIEESSPKVEVQTPDPGPVREDRQEQKMAQAPEAAAPTPVQEPTPPAPTPEVAEQPQRFELNTQSRLQRLSSNRQTSQQTVVQNTQQGISAPSSDASRERSTNAPSRNVQGLGSDQMGEEARSSGARGLASREGISSAYMSPRTVVLGSMDPELLRKILREYLPQFRHCYQQEINRTGQDLSGVIDLDFRIGQSGNVERVDISVSGGQFSPQGTNCMSNVLRMINFPAPKGGGVVDVRQPLNFSAERTKL